MSAPFARMASAALAAMALVVAVLVVPRTGAGAAVGEPGDILVVDSSGAAVKKVDRATGAISVVAAGGLLAAPVDVAVAQDGSLLVADFGYAPDVVIRIDGQTGAQSYVNSTSSSGFEEPRSIALEADGTILVRSITPPLVRLDPGTGMVTPIGGNFDLANSYQGVAVAPDGSIYTVRPNRSTDETPSPADVLRIDPGTGTVTVVSTGGPLTATGHLVLAADGSILVTDFRAGIVVEVNPRTGVQRVVTQGLSAPIGIELDRDGSILVTETTRDAAGLRGSLTRVVRTTGAQSVLASERLASQYRGYYGLTVATSSSPARPVETSLQADPVAPSLFRLRARLTETRSGAPLGGQVVTMSTGVGQICQATTDADGVATCEGLAAALSIVVENGYTATFAGTSELRPSSSRATLLAPGATPAPTPRPERAPDVTPRPRGPSDLPPLPTASGPQSGVQLPATGSGDRSMSLALVLLVAGGALFRAMRRAGPG